jgi:hypothetical protein
METQELQARAEFEGAPVQVQRLEVGTIVHGSWGYDQTNPEFYQVVRRSAKSVWLVQLGCQSVRGTEGFMSEQVVPGKPLLGRYQGVAGPGQEPKVYGPVRIKVSTWAKVPEEFCNEPCHGHCTLSIWKGGSTYHSWYA